jgi:hypothetical protein
MEATTTDQIIDIPTTDTPVIESQVTDTPVIESPVINSPLMISLEAQSYTASFGTSTPTINTILNDYFGIFPASYLFILVGIGIMGILIYTLYSYLDN